MAETALVPNNVKAGEWILVDPIHCHQRIKKNQLIEKVRLISGDKSISEVKFRFIPEELDFFFDHKIDHLPGMLEVNGMRQLSLAVAHLIYQVPMNHIALLGWLKVMFYSYGEIGKDTFGKVHLLESRITKFKREYVMSGIMYQDETKLIRMDGKLIMMHPALADKVRFMKVNINAEEVNDAPLFSW